VLGLCVGSFVNMLMYRTAVRYDLIKNPLRGVGKKQITNKRRSFCDFCGRQLKWYENVPVISWLIQSGKSRCCKEKLPIAYPLLELSMGILFVIYDMRYTLYDVGLMWGLGLVVITLLVFSAAFDAKYMILPDFSTYILIILALVGLVFDEQNIVPYLLSALGSVGFLGALNVLTRGQGMGEGDVKLAVFMGLFLGWPKILLALYVAFVAGAVVGLVLMSIKRHKARAPIPFGPFLIGGLMVAWWWGEKVVLPFFN